MFYIIWGEGFITKIQKISDDGIDGESNAVEKNKTSFRNILNIFKINK